MNAVFLGLGGNIGNRKANIQNAISEIEQRCGTIEKKSRLYETEAWGTKSKHKYLNQVVKISTSLTPHKLLNEILKIEKKLGRKRTAEKFSDRNIDIDILFFNAEIVNLKNLKIPHPRVHERRFMLEPLAELAPGFEHPLLKKSIRALLKACPDKLKVSPINDFLYICVEGNIGSGKSTLAYKLAGHLKAELIPEQFEKSNLLTLFYDHPSKYAFPLEFHLLLNRYEQLIKLTKQKKKVFVSDYWIQKSLWFAKVNLPKKEYRLFEKHFNALSTHLPLPDLVIYLRTSPKNLLQNIVSRGRKYEEKLKPPYLAAVEKAYKKGMAQLAQKTLYIDIDRYHSTTEKDSIKTIEKYLAKNFGLNDQKRYI
jgi:2-amino-4-hydroxy-6-hydroxymethyldihydropteridine diphosphokinase